MDRDANRWREDLERWLEPFLARLSHPARRRMCPLYIAGLIGPGDRKSVQPMAHRLGMGSHDRLHHFISGGLWDAEPLEAELVRHAHRLVGGSDAYLVIDDTALPKKGQHSVGVAPPYASALGKKANCQTLVSITLAKGEVPVPVALRLFLPERWTNDSARLDRAGVPEEHRPFRTKPERALAEIDRLREAGVDFGVVLTDAGYGHQRPVPPGPECPGAGLGGRDPASPEGLSGRCPADLSGGELRSTPPAARSRSPRGHRRDDPGRGQVANRELAPGYQGQAQGAVRRDAGAGRRWSASAHRRQRRSAHARRGSVAGGRAPLVGRTEVLPFQPARRHRPQDTGRGDQGALGLRAGPPTAQGGTRPRPLRGPLLERAAPTRAHDADRFRVPPAPPPRRSGAGKKASTDRRLTPACRPCGRPSPTISGACIRPRHAALIAGAGSSSLALHQTCQSSASPRPQGLC